MKPNLDIVRDLLKKVYSVRNDEPLVLDENWILSPMGDGNLNPENDFSEHVHLLVKHGLLIFSNRIKSNREPNFATIELTSKAKDWAYCAFDDTKWQNVKDDILQFLSNDEEK
jgi:hypothetical protein